MNKMRHALTLLFLVSLGLDAPPGSAAADPVESDTFKFTWLGVPIGEVTIHYGSYEDPKRAFGPEPAALTGTHARMSERQSRGHTNGGHEDRESVRSFRLGALEGRTNGLVRWLKRYEGAYRTTLTPGGSRYEVMAMDQGAPEVRDIWFGAKPTDTPQVLDFRDRSSAGPLQPLTGVDEGSVDPIRLMAIILKTIDAKNGCPAVPEAFRVFDGKRRYEARLSQHDWVDTAALGEKIDTIVPLESSGERGKSSAGDVIVNRDDNQVGDGTGVVSRNGTESALGRFGKKEEMSDQDRDQLKLTGIGTSVAQKSEELMDRAPRTPVPHALDCRLTLVARDAPRGFPTQQGLFWPFNRRDLTVDFSVSLNGAGARFRSFLVRAPVGQIKGRRIN